MPRRMVGNARMTPVKGMQFSYTAKIEDVDIAYYALHKLILVSRYSVPKGAAASHTDSGVLLGL